MKRKKYEELTFTDDFMFCKVLVNNLELCRLLLELLLGIKIRKVVNVTKQKSIDITADAKSVRLDVYVYVEDTEESVYDVEMQTSVSENLPKRSRYYQGMIDLNLIEKGDDYTELKKSYIVFICMEDPFDRNLPVYTFENRCKEAGDLRLGDEAIKVFINANGDTAGMSEDMRRFLKYLKGGYAEEDSLAGCIEKEVEKAREHLEWRTEYMTLQMRYNEIAAEARAEGRAEGRAEVRSEIIREMLRNNVSIEVIAKCCNMSEEAIRKMADEQKSV